MFVKKTIIMKNKELPIILLDGPVSDSDDFDTVELHIDVFGESLRAQIGVKDRPARLPEMVPMARSLSDRLVNAVKKQLLANGKAISCRKGCFHCCYYIVPVLSAEAFLIRDEIMALPPAERKPVLENFLNAIERIHSAKIPAYDVRTAGDDPMKNCMENIANWYRELNIACPLLADNACSMYEQRPLICRECLTISPPVTCKNDSQVTPESVELPVSITRVFTSAADKLEAATSGISLLPLLIPWCESNPQKAEQAWPAKMMVEYFVEAVYENIRIKSG
jgi:Fe-S-cluster containining protein